MKLYIVEIQQTGRASTTIRAASEEEARAKIQLLIDQQALNSEMVQGWDSEEIMAIDEAPNGHGYSVTLAAENQAALEGLAENGITL